MDKSAPLPFKFKIMDDNVRIKYNGIKSIVPLRTIFLSYYAVCLSSARAHVPGCSVEHIDNYRYRVLFDGLDEIQAFGYNITNWFKIILHAAGVRTYPPTLSHENGMLKVSAESGNYTFRNKWPAFRIPIGPPFVVTHDKRTNIYNINGQQFSAITRGNLVDMVYNDYKTAVDLKTFDWVISTLRFM